MIKHFYIMVLMLLISKSHGQTTNLENVQVSIGESLSEVISKVDTNFYNLTLTEPQNMEQIIFLATKSKPTYLLGVMYFFVPTTDSQAEPPTLKCIQKLWTNNSVSTTELMIKFYNLLDKFGADQYEKDYNYKKNIEPDGITYNINIKTHEWHEIEFVFSENYLQLSELYTEDGHKFDDKIYYLFFDDYNNYFDKNSNIIIEKFLSEKEAEERKRILQIPYLFGSDNTAKFEILRVYRNRFK